MATPKGPGSPFEMLFAQDSTHEGSVQEDGALGQPLPTAFQQFYPGGWPIPAHADRPYIYSNFAISRDGRISFNLPGQAAAQYVTKAAPHDRWLMGLLRMRADAVLVGDTTVRNEKEFLSSAESIYPDDAEAFAAQRKQDGRATFPLTVILSADGCLPAEAPCLNAKEQHVILATTSKGMENARQIQHPQLDLLEFAGDLVDLRQLVRILFEKYNVRTLLCEGGANVFGGMLAAGLIDEEFVTWCPTFVGRAPDAFRPSYCEGIAWTPDAAPYSRPVSLHKGGDYLYLRTRTTYNAA
jgi:5-amino-6-(5-phosphoribosylamino)uracil reductase